MPSIRRTEFADFVADLLDFIEEKIRDAVENETSRPAAIAEARRRRRAAAGPPARERGRPGELHTAA
ncbi:hypothetical protein ABIF65_009295 [Bradyrhizobium japonicum]|uniref:hypothetical protein n=1 Tax=Bradyrhizobium TaxID=374 RepID=UPI00040F2695|nr:MULTISPECIES: hypothetical protein [Bradyrhizobium]MBR0944381.1 hypothetical protein [Bradyrhizobium liaoningense]MBR1003070.1 hypothetical protein [Bradyrhizobium liaoningense]MBR1030704.1 hypothetical protein [Bradyrhizobium liaoningense]MCP1747347.1 hypothetical protein [Bradyrhizobium japonicum]MCP1774845.1 hypothetical protein [Bradyrhizobium japonicum]